ncbi:unnamed protein product [Dovyalis caffra]|uniref:Uncharacterized protein n=1 Tax=Dovyalis caffra TaxID=77055 RepID=A0AAV1QV50_9ROSI|nr:unnamed protein product [Dovyalis caffra]
MENLLLLYTIPKILDSDSASENCFLGKGRTKERDAVYESLTYSSDDSMMKVVSCVRGELLSIAGLYGRISRKLQRRWFTLWRMSAVRVRLSPTRELSRYKLTIAPNFS